MPCSQIRQGIKEANYIFVDYLCPCSSGAYILAAISNNNKISRLANICLYRLLFIQLCRVNGDRLLSQITHNIIMQISSILHFIKMTHNAPCPCTHRHTLPYTSLGQFSFLSSQLSSQPKHSLYQPLTHQNSVPLL